MREKVFLIHGLFMHGVIMQYMRNQLSALGYDVYTFSYKTTKKNLRDNAQLLVEFIQKQQSDHDVCHFVGHSLGGILIRLAYESAPEYFTGRIVTLGTPHNGSKVAQHIVQRLPVNILGGAYEDALDGDLPPWKGEVDLGSIAGTKGLGIGLALSDLDQPNDGTVAWSETQLTHQKDSISFPLTHTALIYSKKVVEQTDHFLRYGRFEHEKLKKNLSHDHDS